MFATIFTTLSAVALVVIFFAIHESGKETAKAVKESRRER